MLKIKELAKKVINSDNWPFFIFFIILLFFHIRIGDFHSDDEFFGNALSEGNTIIQFLVNRYNTWSSRLIIETVTVFVAKFELNLWKILNIGIYILLAKSISKICSKENNKILNYIICALILLFPIPILNNTGWVATTTNYLWVASLGIYSLSIIINYLRKIKIPKWEYICYLLATLYACNQEQMAVVIFLVFGICILHQLLKKGYKYIIENEKFLIILFIISTLSLIFILTCPGNANRKISEVNYWYPEYENFRMLEKIELGLTSTVKTLVLDTNNIFIIFTLTIFIAGCIYNKNKWIRIICLIPFLASIFNTFFIKNLAYLFPNIIEIIGIFSANQLIMSLNQISVKYLCVMFIEALILLLVPIGIYNIFKKDIKTYVCIGIYLLGLITRFIMCFSPTIFASGERTFTILYVSFIICTIMILEKVIVEKRHIK